MLSFGMARTVIVFLLLICVARCVLVRSSLNVLKSGFLSSIFVMLWAEMVEATRNKEHIRINKDGLIVFAGDQRMIKCKNNICFIYQQETSLFTTDKENWENMELAWLETHKDKHYIYNIYIYTYENSL